jgi:hypothetical protein
MMIYFKDLPLTQDKIKHSMMVGNAPRLLGSSSSLLSPEKSITDSIRCEASIRRTVESKNEKKERKKSE